MGNGNSSRQEKYYDGIEGNEVAIDGCDLEGVNAANMKKLPHNCIGLLVFLTDLGQKGFGTAFLVSPFEILTVAHNIYHRRTG